MQKRWVLKGVQSETEARKLADTLNIEMSLARLLIKRGVNDFDEAKSFFRPKLEELHDPYLMQDMDQAVDHINHCLKDNKKILVYGDYDVDGTTSVSMMYDFLAKYTDNIDFYIPDRYSEGYGVSFQAIDWAEENQFDLIISLDCGIKAVDKVSYASEKGIDFIICDHHNPGDTLPNAIAILDPKRTDCNYPYKELSGCGVGFKLIQALLYNWNESQSKAFEYLDLLAISIAADIVPITLENRTLCYHGLKQIRDSKRPGIKALLNNCKINGEVSVGDIGFKIGPRINAAGRMDHGKKAVQLLTTDDYNLAVDISNEVHVDNEDRKEQEKQTFIEACEQLDKDPHFPSKRSIVVYQEDWHKGIIGIVASRLVEKYYKPTIVLTKSNGKVAGSARSVKGFSIYDAIERCEETIIQFGGHKYAAGLTLGEEQVEDFKNAFEISVSEHISESQLVPEVDIEEEISLAEITPKFLRILKQFEPFGPQNPSPIFASKNLTDMGEARILGGEHLKLGLSDVTSNEKFPAIAFKMGDKMNSVLNGKHFNAAYSIEENHFNGRVTTQLMIKDIK